MQISSTAFAPNQNIPTKFTCEGQDISPELSFKDVPENAKALVLIVDDPDAPMGTWTHWVLYNIPATTSGLTENIKTLPQGSLDGTNSWNKLGYGGPCPPSGTHRYFFKLYALDQTINLKEGATSDELLNAIEGHIITKTEMIGLYQKINN